VAKADGRETLLERDAALEPIDRGLRAAIAGDGSLLGLQGPAGIGKTRLVRAAAATPVCEHVAMYAVVRKLTYDQTRLAAGGRQQLVEFNAIHERQPGFRGSLVLRAEDGGTVALNLWESERDAMAGLEVLRPAVQQLIEPLLREPAVLVGAGRVIDNTLRLA
jgi:hypothetical protein